MKTKIIVDNKIMEKVNLFSYLENKIFYQGQIDNDNKLNNILKITVVLNNVFWPQKPLGKQN